MIAGALLATALWAQTRPALTAALRSFDRVLLLEEKGETSAGVSTGDINGDGRPDIVLGKGRHWPLFNRVLLNDGQGGYLASNLGAAPDRTYSAALADVDGDGDLDIVVSNDAPDRKLVYLNDGKGLYTEFGTFGQPQWSTRYVTLADLNGDGHPDIVAANRGDYPDLVDGKPGTPVPQPSYVCVNDGKGRFEACQPLPTESATSIVAADFDGDGAPDLFVPHRDGGQSVLLWNDGKGHFPATTKVGPANAWVRMGAAGDLDGNGRPDLAIIDERLKATFVLFNRGRRQFGEPVRLPGPERPPYCLAIADLNRDNRPDIIVGYVQVPGSVYLNSEQGRSFREVPWNDGKGTVYGVAFGDFDGDGWPDIVSARSGAPNGIWFNAKPSSGR
ncbi:MAG: VCBS repeat-containing protein [Acidobacteria bacterium]|nr:VCBS repeat-containing protein [Acidobacteriota bacterium]